MPVVFVFSAIYVLGLYRYSRNSNYLDYLFSLNYWSSNTFLILSFIFFFIRFQSRLSYLFFFKVFIVSKLTQTFIIKKKLVDALLIGTLVIHPILFYVSLIMLCLRVIYSRQFYFLGSRPVRYSNLALILSITLLLGGFWGFQSTIWGYFWVNDTVEWLLLLAIFYSVWYLHKMGCFLKVWNLAWFFFFIVNLILIVRLNLIPTRHNFIQASSVCLIVFLVYTLLLSFIAQGHWKNTYLSYSLIFTCVFVTLYFNLLFLKSFCWIYTLFFLFNSGPKTFLKKLYMHFVLFIFFALWNIYFTYFYILYAQISELYTNVLYQYEHFTLHYKQFIVYSHLKDLEGVDFITLSDTLRVFRFTFETTCFVLLSNPALMVLPLFYFLFL